jgi:uncharacterized protein (UPF0261 family)
MSTIAVIGTLDSKGHEHAFVAELIRQRGHHALLIDLGTGDDPVIEPDITRFEVAAAAGVDLQPLLERHDRGECVVAMSQAIPFLLEKLASEGKIHGVISLGGGGGTALATAGMRALPLGFPKLMVSTLASGNTAHYLGTKDIAMMPAIVDVSGLNRISRMVFSRAAAAICAMVETPIESAGSKPIIVASMFGNTTECINYAREVLENAGYEVLVFHATGAGGKAMEDIIASGMVSGVLDVTTTEWADEYVGGTLSAGVTRLDAAAIAGVPAVIAPGCLDMVNFGAKETIPEKFAGRNFYIHNPQVTLMRTTAEECEELGKIIAEKANRYTAPVTLMIPEKGISVISEKGQPFYDSAADEALFHAIHQHAKVSVISLPETINSRSFAIACAEQLLKNIDSHSSHSLLTI